MELFVKNPLNRYYEEHHEYLHKPSKHNNGPAIISMKYTDGRLGNKIDISKNYSLDTEKKKSSPSTNFPIPYRLLLLTYRRI